MEDNTAPVQASETNQPTNPASEIVSENPESPVEATPAQNTVENTNPNTITLTDEQKRFLDSNGEVWKPVVGWEGLYEVSSIGRVRSIKPRKGARCKIMRLDIGRRGYLRVHLCIDGKSKQYLAHRLVAEAFIGKCPDGKVQINHIDGVPSNNCADNLEWADQSDQERHKIYNLKNASNSLLHSPIEVLCVENNEVFSSLNEASRKTNTPLWRMFNCVHKGVQNVNGLHYKYK